MPSTINSCFPKIKRPQSQADPPFPVIVSNFNSLYSSHSQTVINSHPPLSPEFQYGAAASTPDLSAVYASRRFFISSPGRSNSIIDSSASSSSFGSDTSSVMKNSVAVPTYSPDPYADFRRSMEEMVEARENGSGQENDSNNWEYLHELLLCYLALNPKATHKFIIGAFADLVVDHMPKAPALKSRTEAAVDVEGGRLK
uniref:Transcription repressor n=1 Tax=Kalanchoe fedtschenkoi TaxID=63787 RepID=A0A7N0ZRW4_KALFE